METFKIWRFFILFTIPFTMIFSASQTAEAHAYSASFTTLELTKSETTMTYSLDEVSVMELTGSDVNENGRLESEELEANREKIESIVEKNVYLEIDGVQQNWTELREIHNTDKGEVQFVAAFPAISPSQSISFKDILYINDTKTNYVNLLTINYGDQSSSAALSEKDRMWSMLLTETDYAGLKAEAVKPEPDHPEPATPSAETKTSGWFSFLKLGMHHILFGFDHLLFLLALLIMRQSFKQLALVITAFTIAHSITITLTVLGWIQVPPLFVEAVIALSICYVALENIFKKTVNHREMLTFVFGLIHGMGFAGILLEMNLPKNELAVNLASFNIGIEIIQLMIVALLLPLLALLHRWKHARYAVVSISSVAFLLGALWLFERLFLS